MVRAVRGAANVIVCRSFFIILLGELDESWLNVYQQLISCEQLFER
jgi:hypothetical protein